MVLCNVFFECAPIFGSHKKNKKFVLILDLGNGYQVKSTAVRRM